MATDFNRLPPRQALAAIARDFHRRGWMAGTAGNLSVRADNQGNRFWITASGLPKGMLEERDFIQIAVADGRIVQPPTESARPSAETSIHQMLYRMFPECGACLHVHTVDACLATAHAPPTALTLRLPPLEMVKGLGIWDERPQADLPLFDNLADVTAIAQAIERRFEACPPRVPALMIRNHGVTVWGANLQDAYNRVEIVEFIMSYLARAPR